MTRQGVAVELAPSALPGVPAHIEQFLPLGPGHLVEIQQLLQLGSLHATAAVLDPADLAGVTVEGRRSLLLEFPDGLALAPQRGAELQSLHRRPLLAHAVSSFAGGPATTHVLDVGTLQAAQVHHVVHLVLSELGLSLAGADATSGRCAGLPHVAGGPS